MSNFTLVSRKVFLLSDSGHWILLKDIKDISLLQTPYSFTSTIVQQIYWLKKTLNLKLQRNQTKPFTLVVSRHT